MLAKLECLPCILDDVIGAMELLHLPRKQKERIIKECLQYLSHNFNTETIPSYYITHVHRILKRISGYKTPFKKLRRDCNQTGIKIANSLAKRSASLPGFARFRYLVKWAIAGNLLDFRTVGTGYGLKTQKLARRLSQNVKEGLSIDETKSLARALKKSNNKVLYVLDNVGEIAIDKLLIREIIQLGNSVVVPVRGGPITSDVVAEDARKVDLASSGAKIILAGPDTLGISWKEKSKELAEALQTADIVITKGQANYYVVSEHRKEIPGKVFCLFTTKCDLVSNIFGLQGKVNLAVEL